MRIGAAMVKELNSRQCHSKAMNIFRGAHLNYMTILRKIVLQFSSVQVENNDSLKSFASLALSP